MTVRRCRSCGCSDLAPCVFNPSTGQLVDVLEDGETSPDGFTVCSWIEIDLCSACVQGHAAPLLFDAHGNPLRGAP
jgi:hypothetical protein